MAGFRGTAGKMGFRWWLWVFADGRTVIYKIDPSRSHQVPQDHLGEDAQGVLLVDRYSAYKAMKAVKSGSLLLGPCATRLPRSGQGLRGTDRLGRRLAEANTPVVSAQPRTFELRDRFTPVQRGRPTASRGGRADGNSVRQRTVRR